MKVGTDSRTVLETSSLNAPISSISPPLLHRNTSFGTLQQSDNVVSAIPYCHSPPPMSTSAKLNVVIGGGAGLIGKALTSKLLSKNANVRIISRNPNRSGDLSWKVVESSGLPGDTHVVINLAGSKIGEVSPRLLIPSVMRSFLQDVYSSRVKTTQILVKSIPKTTKTFINASAIGFYEPHLSRCYTEDDPSVDYGFLARLVRDWEAACSGTQLEGVQRVFVRTGIVLSKNGGALSKMYPAHRLGLGGPIGSGQQWLSWIHIDDLVNLYCFLIMNPAGRQLTGAVNGTAPCPVRQGAFSRAFSESLGVPSIGGCIPTPAFVIRAIMGKERAPLLLEGQRVLPAKVQAAGFKFNFPTLELALESIYGRRPQPVPID
ncbi:epimerase family protein sdr39u1 [Echinococcus multilocularis]|uniref:Epimerase family protein sdr39u1 n=1 Tax=Echinococcus multilocularis TaxID=6211 RepID=A0A068Y435_ECHMU|nr:epimerase family protein sdr39u1 [Echinococcus multilocularis]